MKKVLCVCFGNTCRSPMMQVLLQQELGSGFKVESAGINKGSAGQSANEHSVLCMQERGVSLSGHTSRWVGDLDLTQFSHIICVGESEAERVCEILGIDNGKVVVLVANEEGGGVLNPWEKGLPAYRECLALLDKVLPKIANTIRG